MMKYLLIFIFLVAPFNEVNKIKKINDYKKKAEDAYLKNNFEEAAEAYKYLIDSLGVEEPEVQLNYANSLFYLNDTLQARSNYAQVASNTSNDFKSIAHQQLGLMDYYSQHYEESLKHFKQSLKADPSNEEARYNYELLKKLLEEQEQDPENQEQNEDSQEENNEENQENQEQEQQDQDQQQQDQEQQDQDSEQQENQEQQQQDQEGEKSEEQQEQEQQEQQDPEEGENEENKEDQMDPSVAEKLEEMNISEEKARMILEALKNNEIQYLQQNKRKATKRPEKGKPDW